MCVIGYTVIIFAISTHTQNRFTIYVLNFAAWCSAISSFLFFSRTPGALCHASERLCHRRSVVAAGTTQRAVRPAVARFDGRRRRFTVVLLRRPVVAVGRPERPRVAAAAWDRARGTGSAGLRAATERRHCVRRAPVRAATGSAVPDVVRLASAVRWVLQQ